MKYIKLVDGLKSNANGFEYKIGEINELKRGTQQLLILH